MNLPKEFEDAHFACLYIHDVMVEFIRSGEQNQAFHQTFDLSDDEKKSLESSDIHILDWLEENNRNAERMLAVRATVLPAVLSDMLHCIFEALASSKHLQLLRKERWQ